MDIKKLTERIYYLPHQADRDRPMLAYIKGNTFSLAVDAGYSANHVNDFYKLLEENGLKKPDFTVVTHWHYDHTFGMHQIHGVSIAHEKTNAFLKAQQEKAGRAAYIDILKNADPCFAKEYESERALHIVLADMQFQKALCINLGGITAQIFHTESPHSEDTVCLYIPEEKVLFLGDSTSEDFFNEGYMDKGKLQKLIDMIEEKDCVYCLLSHTEPLIKEELLSYLEAVVSDKREN